MKRADGEREREREREKTLRIKNTFNVLKIKSMKGRQDLTYKRPLANGGNNF